MEIGNDDFVDDIDDFEDNTLTQNTEDEFEDYHEDEQPEDVHEETSEDSQTQPEDIVNSLLKDKGIEDPSRIKFENDEGEIEELPWESLSNQEKLEILRTQDTVEAPETGLDDSEIELINAIRNSQMTPTEYINYMQQQGVNNYINNMQQPRYKIDDMSDDDLYMTDVLAKIGPDNISAEELADMLLEAKKNETLFQKQIEVLRNDYRTREQEDIQNQQMYQQQTQIEKYNQFAETVENEIRNFTDFGGFDLDMSEDEMEELYDFITGFDQAGVSIFSKALNDPQLLVRMAWFALNGDQAMQDINDYWTNELKNTRRNNQKPKDKVAIKKTTKNKSSDDFDDLDDF